MSDGFDFSFDDTFRRAKTEVNDTFRKKGGVTGVAGDAHLTCRDSKGLGNMFRSDSNISNISDTASPSSQPFLGAFGADSNISVNSNIHRAKSQDSIRSDSFEFDDPFAATASSETSRALNTFRSEHLRNFTLDQFGANTIRGNPLLTTRESQEIIPLSADADVSPPTAENKSNKKELEEKIDNIVSRGSVLVDSSDDRRPSFTGYSPKGNFVQTPPKKASAPAKKKTPPTGSVRPLSKSAKRRLANKEKLAVKPASRRTKSSPNVSSAPVSRAASARSTRTAKVLNGLQRRPLKPKAGTVRSAKNSANAKNNASGWKPYASKSQANGTGNNKRYQAYNSTPAKSNNTESKSNKTASKSKGAVRKNNGSK